MNKNVKKEIFDSILIESEKEVKTVYGVINDQSIVFQDKINKILYIKGKNGGIGNFTKNNKILSDNFYIDGSIKINIDELGEDKEKIIEILTGIAYIKGNSLVFRGHLFYFLFGSAKYSGIEEFGSVNNFKIESLDIKKYTEDIYLHFIKINILLEIFKNNRYKLSNEISEKIILGLIDAKINILSFYQNIALIIGDEKFMNQEYSGRLVFSQEEINILNKRLYRDGKKNLLEKIKANKESIKKQKTIERISLAINHYSEMYINILLGTNSIDDLNLNIDDLKFAIKSIGKYSEDIFNLIYEANNKGIFRGKDYIKKLSQGIFRLYKEENSQIGIIKTAINAYLYLKDNNFDFENDSLCIYSINYGGALVGGYVNGVLGYLGKNRKNFTIGSIVYSKYDLKNSNPELTLHEYPLFSSVKKIEQYTRSSLIAILDNDYETLNKLQKTYDKWKTGREWGLVFDDNIGTGRTLLECKKLLEECGRFKHVEGFACKASPNYGYLSSFSSEYSEDEKLKIIGLSGTSIRKSRLKKNKGKSSNDPISRIIGRTMYKLINKTNE